MELRKTIVLVAAVLGVALTVRLALWQLDRAAQKVALQERADARRALPPLPAAELAATEAQVQEQIGRAVTLEGRWMADRTVYLDNRPMDGRTGFFVVTPLVLADGSVVAVQRGWLPRDFQDRTRIAPPPTPVTPVQVTGRIAPALSRLFEIGTAASGPIRQNLDLAAFGREVGRPLRPLALLQEDAAPDGLQRHWPRPAADVQKHYGYAFQWFALAALIMGLYVWFQLIRPRRR